MGRCWLWLVLVVGYAVVVLGLVVIEVVVVAVETSLCLFGGVVVHQCLTQNTKWPYLHSCFYKNLLSPAASFTNSCALLDWNCPFH